MGPLGDEPKKLSGIRRGEIDGFSDFVLGCILIRLEP